MTKLEIQSAQPVSPSSDERVMAALAHASVLLSFFGPIGPLVIWISQRRKSKYASFHALQAMGYQMAFFWIGMLAWLVLVLIWACVFFPVLLTLTNQSKDPAFVPLLFEGMIFLFMFVVGGFYVLGGIVGTILCLLEKDFRYPLVGRRLEAYLGYDPSSAVLDEEKEDRFVSAVSHLSAILLIWGAISPFTVWITQKDRSRRLRFQALQALTYQLLAVFGYFGFMAAYVLSIVGFAILMGLLSALHMDTNGATAGMTLLVFIGIILLMWIVFMLAIPTYHLFALIAGIQTLKGRDYRYPLLGNLLARWMHVEPTEPSRKENP